MCIFSCLCAIICWTPQGDSGRDGADGRKGEPVSHSSASTLMFLCGVTAMCFLFFVFY